MLAKIDIHVSIVYDMFACYCIVHNMLLQKDIKMINSFCAYKQKFPKQSVSIRIESQ